MLLLLVDSSGDNCNDEKLYSRDLCVEELAQNECLNKVQCTTPFGPDKSKICQNNNDGNVTVKIYRSLTDNSSYYSEYCKYPCSIFTFTNYDYSWRYSTNPSSAEVTIGFEEIIRVTSDYYTYTEISLIAEIGGYVGLFLGVSVNQVTNMMDFFAAKFAQLHDNLKL